jgi:hypothetical protein
MSQLFKPTSARPCEPIYTSQSPTKTICLHRTPFKITYPAEGIKPASSTPSPYLPFQREVLMPPGTWTRVASSSCLPHQLPS